MSNYLENTRNKMVIIRYGHKICNPKSEPNTNQKTRSVPGPKCKNTRMGLVGCYKTYPNPKCY